MVSDGFSFLMTLQHLFIDLTHSSDNGEWQVLLSNNPTTLIYLFIPLDKMLTLIDEGDTFFW